jgi:hypothetical protein
VFKYQKYSNPANLYSSKNFNAFALIQIPDIGNIALDKITEKYTTTASEFALVKAQGFL